MGIINFIVNHTNTLWLLDDIYELIEKIRDFFVLIRNIGWMLHDLGACLIYIFYVISILINSLIYPLVAVSYTLFPLMAFANFSSLGEVFQSLISRIELFIGIVMLFVVAFSILRYMVDPDKNSSETSQIVKRIVVSLVLLVSSTLIFGLFDELQSAVAGKGSDNVIEIIIAGPGSDLEPDEDLDSYHSYLKVGRSIAYTVFFSMYNNPFVTGEETRIKNGDRDLISVVGTLTSSILVDEEGLREDGPMKRLRTGDEEGKKITYTYPVLAGIIGIFLIILFLLFAIDIGVRNFTLLFLRVLFPIAALGYMIPKKGEDILKKYISAYVSAFVELFVKIFTIYLLIYVFIWIINTLFKGGASGVFDIPDDEVVVKVLLMLLFIIALILFFMKGFPKLMQDVFGIKMSSSIGGALGKAMGIAAAGAGLVAGGLTGAIKGGKGGGIGGAVRGMASGAKNMAVGGMNAGKSLAAGKLGAAFKNAAAGVKGTKAGIDAGISKANANKTARTVGAFKKAANAQGEYEFRKAAAEEAAQEASKYAADDMSKEAVEAREKARIAQKQAEKAEKQAARKDKKAVNRGTYVDSKGNVQTYGTKYGNKTSAEKAAEKKAKKYDEKLDRKAGRAAKKVDGVGTERVFEDYYDDEDFATPIFNSAVAGATVGAVAGSAAGKTTTTSGERIEVGPISSPNVDYVATDTAVVTPNIQGASPEARVENASGQTITGASATIEQATTQAANVQPEVKVNAGGGGTQTTVVDTTVTGQSTSAPEIKVQTNGGTTGTQTVTAEASLGNQHTEDGFAVSRESSGSTVNVSETKVNTNGSERVVTTSEQKGSSTQYDKEVVNTTSEGIKYTDASGESHTLKTPSFVNPTTTTVEKEVPASYSERQSASEYSEKMNEKKETVSSDARATISNTINEIEKKEVGNNTVNRVSENAGSTGPSYTGGGSYTVYGSDYGSSDYSGSSSYTYVNDSNSSSGSSTKPGVTANKTSNGTEYTDADGNKHTLKKPSFADRPDAKREDKEELDDKARDERTKNLRSNFGENVPNKPKVDDDSEEDGTAIIERRMEELTNQGYTEKEAEEIATQEYNEGKI